MEFSYGDISKIIDHSLLNPTPRVEQLDAGCRLALDYDAASVCIMPYALRRCADIWKDSGVKASATIGFPHGWHTTATKQAEALQALNDGAEELDMVVNISRVLSGDWGYVRNDIKSVLDPTHGAGQQRKRIWASVELHRQQKLRLCEICGELNLDWVKTSTGHGSGGATLEDLALMRERCPDHVQVKAAGGIRTLERLLEVRTLGVTCVGASRTAEILDECRRRVGVQAELNNA
jgi:deoxyribose-phosphate aldolase